MGTGLPQIGNTDDKTVELLRIIAQNTGGIPDAGDTMIQEGDIAIDGVGDGTQPITYATSGPTGMEIEAEWNDLSLGFVARVVNFRRYEIPIQVAFLNPEERPSWIIPLDPELGESPFMLGNSRGIKADRLWVRADPTHELTDEDIEGEAVHFIAYK